MYNAYTTVATFLFASMSLLLTLAQPVCSQPNSSAIAKIAQNPFGLPQSEDSEMTETRQKSFEFILAGVAFEEAGEDEEAQAYYEAAIETDEENGWGWLLLGRLRHEPRLVKHSYMVFDSQNDAQGKAAAVDVMKSIKASR